MSRIVVFTDMDGSLLNHDSYSFAAAEPLLAGLEQAEIPVVPNTSKTAAELADLRCDLANHHPFIVENGAAVFIPIGYFRHMPDGCIISGDFWVKAFVEPRPHWQQLIQNLQPEFGRDFRTFEQAGTSGIVEMTGLPKARAAQANERNYSEPMLWLGNSSRKHSCATALRQSGAQVLEGGRFMHVSGNCNKGTAMQWLQARYAEQWLTNIVSIAVGDSDNDIAMLEIADYAVIVKAPHKDYPVLQRHQNLVKTRSIAPEGWVEGLRQVLTTLSTTED